LAFQGLDKFFQGLVLVGYSKEIGKKKLTDIGLCFGFT
jgi:hypothetical protein